MVQSTNDHIKTTDSQSDQEKSVMAGTSWNMPNMEPRSSLECSRFYFVDRERLDELCI